MYMAISLELKLLTFSCTGSWNGVSLNIVATSLIFYDILTSLFFSDAEDGCGCSGCISTFFQEMAYGANGRRK